MLFLSLVTFLTSRLNDMAVVATPKNVGDQVVWYSKKLASRKDLLLLILGRVGAGWRDGASQHCSKYADIQDAVGGTLDDGMGSGRYGN
ncbi:hypothetical protein [Ralstonia solanacearum]|uniref:hypothetical protein n=1 Tax=Ralstonia solanacearum TaxID=305 RepID=UPI000F626B99|nr:hypothetical protein [Ralstonia solanacearum]MBB6589522.1 hypothetical protein [Ralstonia solanacearum]MCG3576875.1 hypothetical protein [Ralstonia solanacearum]MCL9827810.1 hypothetical protein [Ralstonia solanacearum]MCL9832530.1 hypothetical protein [Ralstonia solanacearum]MCL9837311.1 hypothetical protein [Ralstonia solanacearum]